MCVCVCLSTLYTILIVFFPQKNHEAIENLPGSTYVSVRVFNPQHLRIFTQESKWRPFLLKPLPSPLMKPVLVFVNPKSGGNQVRDVPLGALTHHREDWDCEQANRGPTQLCVCVCVCVSGHQGVADVHVDPEPAAGV